MIYTVVTMLCGVAMLCVVESICVGWVCLGKCRCVCEQN